MKKRVLLLAILIGFGSFFCAAQFQVNDSLVVSSAIVDSDTLPYVLLEGINVMDSRDFHSKKQFRKWNKLMRNVVKVYPYARITSELLVYYEEELIKIENESERKKYMAEAEDVLTHEFKSEVMNMTVSQGKVLVKLIDRETGHTSYELIKELRNGFTAFMWNSLASLFGNSLKVHYDPIEDYEIETIVKMIENGEIMVAKRDASTAKAQAHLKKKRRKDRKKKNKEKRRKKSG